MATKNLIPTDEPETTSINNKSLNIAIFVGKLRNGIWICGIPSWIFGIGDRSVAGFSDGYLSAPEIIQIFISSFFFLTWLFLKPETSLDGNSLEICSSQTGSLQLKERHMISQEYILPFPYVCQIYHLLNLKHLESIHKFSLNNLKVIGVNQVQATNNGGHIKFQTILDSPINPLRMWRQPIVEVDLILHNPYTVELSIPVYNSKRINVIFHALPLTANEHQFFIDIYSDLDWPKPLLQIIFHFASWLTLFEDLDYLRILSEKNIDRLLYSGRASNHETMWLFKRFVELYSSQKVLSAES
jgi:hypothetical protein